MNGVQQDFIKSKGISKVSFPSIINGVLLLQKSTHENWNHFKLLS